jgi:hypothetical protein
MPRDQRRQRFLARQRCLQERTRRQRHLCRADRDHGRLAHQHQFAVACEARTSMPPGDAGQRRDHGCRQRSGAAHVDVEAGVGRRDLDIERLSGRHQRLGDRPRRIERAAQARIENRTVVDRNDVVGICRRKSHLEHLVGAHARVQGDAAATGAVGIDQRIDLTVEFCLRKGLDDERTFPCAVAFVVPMLDRAAAADAKMRAEWRNPLRARTLDRDQSPAIGMMARHRTYLDRLAAERVRHIDRLSVDKSDAVAAMADVIDDEVLNHGARRGRIRRCRRRP